MYYDNEKYYNAPPGGLEEGGGWDLGKTDTNHAIPVHLFSKHVLDLHTNQVTPYRSMRSTYLY